MKCKTSNKRETIFVSDVFFDVMIVSEIQDHAVAEVLVESMFGKELASE